MEKLTQGRRPQNRQSEEGDDSDPGLASRRDSDLIANVSTSPDVSGWAPLCVAGPLAASLRGLWVSGLLPPGSGGTCSRAATRERTW